MEEKTFLNEDGVTVTNTRFIVSGQLYTMNGITSVKSYRENPSRKGPMLLIGLGLLFLIGGKSVLPFSLLLIAGGGAWWLSQKPKYHVLLHSASGEVRALSNPDESRIARVVGALHEAIVARG